MSRPAARQRCIRLLCRIRPRAGLVTLRQTFVDRRHQAHACIAPFERSAFFICSRSQAAAHTFKCSKNLNGGRFGHHLHRAAFIQSNSSTSSFTSPIRSTMRSAVPRGRAHLPGPGLQRTNVWREVTRRARGFRRPERRNVETTATRKCSAVASNGAGETDAAGFNLCNDTNRAEQYADFERLGDFPER